MAPEDAPRTDASPLAVTLWQQRLGLAAALLLTYAVLVLVPFGVTDDYSNLYYVHRVPRWYMTAVASGRGLGVLLLAGPFRIVRTIDGLRWIRLLGLLGAVALLWQLHGALRRAGWSAGVAAALALLCCLTPPFQCMLSWATMFACQFAAVAAAAAYRFAELGFEARGRSRLWRLAAALALLLASAMIYQVSTAFFLLFLAIDLFRPAGVAPDLWRRGLRGCAVMFGGLLLSFIVFKISVALWGEMLDPARTHLVTDLLGKAEYFVGGPLRDALHLWRLQPVDYLAPVIGVLILIGMWLHVGGTPAQRLARVGAALLLVPGVYVANILTAENWGAYRTQCVLTTLLVFYAGLAARAYVRLLPRRIGPRLGSPALAIIVLLAALGAASNVTTYYAEPQTAELRMLRQQLRRIDLARVKRLHVWGADYNDNLAPGGLARYDEFGIPSSSRPWAAPPLVWLLVRELTGHRPRFEIINAPEKKFKPPKGEALVTLAGMAQYR